MVRKKKKVTFWATKKVPKRVKVTFYARVKKRKRKQHLFHDVDDVVSFLEKVLIKSRRNQKIARIQQIIKEY